MEKVTENSSFMAYNMACAGTYMPGILYSVIEGGFIIYILYG